MCKPRVGIRHGVGRTWRILNAASAFQSDPQRYYEAFAWCTARNRSEGRV